MSNYRFNGVSRVQYNNDLITDISNNLSLTWSEGNVFFEKYTIVDGDTAENIAYRLWNDSSLSWILYIINNIVDPFFDWPMRADELMEYIKNKYGSSNVYSIHHYEKDGFVVNKQNDDLSLTPITNYEYEFRKNEEKRNILLPTDVFIQTFLNQWGEL